MNNSLSKTWGSHGGDQDKCRLLGCGTAWVLLEPTFGGIISSTFGVDRLRELGRKLSVTRRLSHSAKIRPEDGGDMFLLNVGSNKATRRHVLEDGILSSISVPSSLAHTAMNSNVHMQQKVEPR
jgi:hypothetical protein